MQTERKSRMLEPGQKTITVGVRIPSRMDYQVSKVIRELVAQGYEPTKSEIIRFMIEECLPIAKRVYKSRRQPKSVDDK